jgi:hypothetical protein
MKISKTIWILAILIIFTLTLPACDNSISQADSQKIAEDFVKGEATFQFDGMTETFKVINSTASEDGRQYTISFYSRHAGFGNRNGQMLAEVLTPHMVKITVLNGQVTTAVMDGQWNMISQKIDVEIKPAPIEEVKVNILKSNPPQISVYIKGGLPDGGTVFNAITSTRKGNEIEIKVSVQRPAGDYPAIYTSFEKNINLGSNFDMGTTYILKVNDYVTTFEGTLVKQKGFAIYLTREDIAPEEMNMNFPVDNALKPIISMQDIVTYNAQTHEMLLTDEAFERISSMKVSMQGQSFQVCVDEEPIYWGAFWTPFSSQSFNGVNILTPPINSQANNIAIVLGYPAPSFFKGEDPRNNTEVMNSLRQSGKLINE